jgi:nitrogen fixation protein FixH
MKLNWGTGIAIVYTSFAACMILFAVKASQQKYDLVSDKYYDEAVNFQARINAENNTAHAGMQLSMEYSPDENSILLNAEGADHAIAGTLYFYKPDRASDDFDLSFSTDHAGKTIIPLNKLAHGYWKVKASWKIDDKDYFREVKIFIP